MNNIEDEEFVRLILFKGDWSDAAKYFEYSKKQLQDEFIRDALIKVGIVTYAKPFMENTGINKKLKKYRIPKKLVPEYFLWLHEMLMNYRGNFIGHANFKTMKPIFTQGIDTPKGLMMNATYTKITYDHWFKIDQEFPEEPLLIDQAIELSTYLANLLDIPIYSDEDIFS